MRGAVAAKEDIGGAVVAPWRQLGPVLLWKNVYRACC